MRSKTRFNQFINSIEGINPKTLSVRWRNWDWQRKVFPNEAATRIEYYPAEKGLALQSIIDMM